MNDPTQSEADAKLKLDLSLNGMSFATRLLDSSGFDLHQQIGKGQPGHSQQGRGGPASGRLQAVHNDIVGLQEEIDIDLAISKD